MMIVGLTGGIGSGKTAAANRFKHHGVTVINSDALAREVVAPGSDALAQITAHFGTEILDTNGQLNRAALRKIVFEDPAQREWLESLTHPLIAALTKQRLHAPRVTNEPPYRILESPLLLESSSHKQVDSILLIDAPQHVQLHRTMLRDGNTEEQVLAIIKAQMPRDKKHALSDHIVDNSGTPEQLHKKIDTLHQLYCKLAENH